MNWPNIPSDVIDFIKRAFEDADRAVTTVLDNNPNVRESSLDDIFVSSFIPKSMPTSLGSGATVTMNIHNIGGLRRIGRWEVADIAVIIHVASRKAVLGQKIGFLQAKRLYPYLRDIDDEDPIGFRYGMNGLLLPDLERAQYSLFKDFNFNTHCRYGGYDVDQNKRIEEFNQKHGETIFYLFYNPSSIPMRIKHPVRAMSTPAQISLGSRVSRAHEVTQAAKSTSGGGGPTRTMIAKHSKLSDWRVADWSADLLACKVGKQFSQNDEEFLFGIMERRSGPIAAAIQVSIDLPSD
jgi:hypothetical protein